MIRRVETHQRFLSTPTHASVEHGIPARLLLIDGFGQPSQENYFLFARTHLSRYFSEQIRSRFMPNLKQQHSLTVFAPPARTKRERGANIRANGANKVLQREPTSGPRKASDFFGRKGAKARSRKEKGKSENMKWMNMAWPARNFFLVCLAPLRLRDFALKKKPRDAENRELFCISCRSLRTCIACVGGQQGVNKAVNASPAARLWKSPQKADAFRTALHPARRAT